MTLGWHSGWIVLSTTQLSFSKSKQRKLLADLLISLRLLMQLSNFGLTQAAIVFCNGPLSDAFFYETPDTAHNIVWDKVPTFFT
jgi:hypothetical protein